MLIVSLKRAEVEQKGGTLLGEAVDTSREDYYYGLRITLENPEMQKLGVAELKVGAEIPVMAIMKVRSFAEEETGKRAELQITHMGLKTPDEDQRPDMMYPAGQTDGK